MPACGPAQSTARGSYAEAVAQFESGLELLQKPPDDEGAELELDLRNATAARCRSRDRPPLPSVNNRYIGASTRARLTTTLTTKGVEKGVHR